MHNMTHKICPLREQPVCDPEVYLLLHTEL